MNIESSAPANTVKRDYWLPILMIVLVAVAYSPVIVISAIWEMAVRRGDPTCRRNFYAIWRCKRFFLPGRVSQQILTNCSHILIGGSVCFRGRG